MPDSLFSNFNKPNPIQPVSPEKQALWDKYVEEQQANDPTWKKVLRAGSEGISGAVSSLFGKDFETGDKSPFATGNALGQLAQAGLPFLAYKPKLKGEQVYHGTQKVFEKFDPRKYDTSDVLGWMTHFAEEPKYAQTYASGASKGVKQVDFNPSFGPVDEGELQYEKGWNVGDKPYTPTMGTVHPRTIPAEIKAKNVLDLVDPNPDDLSQALAALNLEDRKHLIKNFKSVRAVVRDAPNERAHFLRPDHYPGAIKHTIPSNEIALRNTAEKLRLTPEEFESSPFDAIRYRDNEHKSWAIPERTPIETPWGTPLNNPPKELKVFKHYQDTGSQAEPTKLFKSNWKNNADNYQKNFEKSNPQIYQTKTIELKNEPFDDTYGGMFTKGHGELNSTSQKGQVNTSNKPIASIDPKVDPEGWADIVIKANPHYTHDSIMDMYFNSVINATERQALAKAIDRANNVPELFKNANLGWNSK